MEGSDDLKSAFVEHHKEIKRRGARAADSSSAKCFAHTEDDDGTDKFELPEQTCFLYSLSNTGFGPICEHENPGIRIYGAFASAEEAVEHVEIVRQYDASCSMMIGQIQNWHAAVCDPTEYADADFVCQHIDKLLKMHTQHLDENAATFHENVEEQKAGSTTEPEANKQEASETKSRGKTHRLPVGAEVRDQRFAVVSFVRDDATPPRFLFTIYGFFATEVDCNRYVRNAAGEQVTDHDICVVSTCQWLFPQKVRSAQIREVYRDDELNRIMGHHKKQPAEVKRYKDWKTKSEAEHGPYSETKCVILDDEQP
jgi:hypothetical protein